MIKNHCNACDDVIPNDEVYLELKVVRRLGAAGVEFGDDMLSVCENCRTNSQGGILTAIMDHFDQLKLDDEGD